jgi:hypothetical protein
MWFRQSSVSRLRAIFAKPQIFEAPLPTPVPSVATAPQVQIIREVYNPTEDIQLVGIGGTLSTVGNSFVHTYTVVGPNSFVVSAGGIPG